MAQLLTAPPHATTTANWPAAVEGFCDLSARAVTPGGGSATSGVVRILVSATGGPLADVEVTFLHNDAAVERIVGKTSNGLADGREVVFTYVNNALSTVSDRVRVWRYGHVTSPDGGPSYPLLAQVQRPDGRSSIDGSSIDWVESSC